MTQKPPIPPLFKADSATLSFSASKDGKVTLNYQGWDANKVIPDQYVQSGSPSATSVRG